MNESALAVIRRAYAKNTLFLAGVDDPDLESALAQIRREDFLGPGPWQIMQPPGGYKITPTDNPVYLYQDVLVGMMSDKGLNNGQPSFLLYLISLGDLTLGESVVHIGTGRGYYTALMALKVGETGAVQGIEYESKLAAAAAANLAKVQHVKIHAGDGTTCPLIQADVIYVNAGAVRPAKIWLDSLKDGGRLILPLTVSYQDDEGVTMTRGAIFLIRRQSDEYFAQWKSPTAIYPCAGARDTKSENALVQAFKKGGYEKVRRLYRTGDVDPAKCWVRGDGWSLAYE